MGLFRPAKVVRQTGRAAPTNFLGYVLLFLAMATGMAAWSRWPRGKRPGMCPSSAPVPPRGGAWRLWAARHSQGETRPLGSVSATASGARASLRGGQLHGV